MGLITINVKMVCIHGSDYSNLREELEERTVKLVCLSNDHIILIDEKVGVIVLRDTTKEGRTTLTCGGEKVAGQCTCGGLSMSSGNSHATLSGGNFTKHLGTFDDPVTVILNIYKLTHIVRDGRCIYHEGILHILRDIAAVIGVMHLDALCLKSLSQRRRSLVIAADLESLGIVIPCDGTHSDAADADEIYVCICAHNLIFL